MGIFSFFRRRGRKPVTHLEIPFHRLIMNDGSEYIGAIIYSDTLGRLVPHGRGKLTLRDGTIFYGEFVDGNMMGQFMVYYSDGSSYDGSLRGRVRCGRGTFCYSNGAKYVGEWYRDLENGEGTLFTSRDGMLSGKWEDGRLTGPGTETLRDGTRFEGEFRASAKVRGKLTYPNGDVYEGEFCNGSPHGIGKKTLSDGTVFAGRFACGKYLSPS